MHIYCPQPITDHKMNIFSPPKKHSSQNLHLLSHNQWYTTQNLSTVPQPITQRTLYIYCPTPITHHTLYSYSPTNNHTPHNVYLLSNNKSLNTQIISTVPQLLTHRTMYILCPTTNNTTQSIPNLHQTMTLVTIFIYFSTNNQSPQN